MSFFNPFRKKKQPPSSKPKRAAPKSEGATRHCFVLCAPAEPRDLSRASAIAAKVLGRGYTAEVCGEQIVEIKHRGETMGFLAHMPAPVPGGEAEESADENFLWPNGREETAAHQSHVIVTVARGDLTPVQSAIAVSRLALVALELYDGIGVYWGNACVCNSRAIFEDFCEDISEEHVPVPVWLRFQVVRADNDEVGLYTLGMPQFGLMDIEVDSCRMPVGDLFEFVSNIAHYLIQSGPVIEDGNTVGGSEDERILVRHLPSMIDEERLVYKIVFS